MATLKIYGFKTKEQYRVSFVKLLVGSNLGLGLKSAKEKMDDMLDGIPIVMELSDDLLSVFIEKLDDLKLEYEVINY